MNRIAAFLHSIRPLRIALFVIGEVTIILYALWGEAGFSWSMWLSSAFPVCTVLAALLAAGFLMNDLLDVDIDKVNARVIFVDIIGRKAAALISGTLFLLAIVTGFAINTGLGIIFLLDALGLVLYNIFGKRVFWMKAVLLPTLIITIYPMAYFATPWMVVSPRKFVLFAHAGWLFLMAAAYEVFHDITDLAGDQAAAVETIPSRLGVHFAGILAFALSAAACAVAFIPRIMGWCANVYLLFVLLHLLIVIAILWFPPEAKYKGVLAAISSIVIGSFLDILL